MTSRRTRAMMDGMVVWINGPFGVGKTAVARALRGRIPGAVLFDPEWVGLVLARLTPAGRRTGDFQDLPTWRRWTVRLAVLAERTRRGPVIVPMTVADHRILEETFGELRRRGIDTRHVTLLASRDELRHRIRGRRGDSWAERQMERCLTNLPRREFGPHLDTDGRSVREVADGVRAVLGV
jgi:hypothetical protein